MTSLGQLLREARRDRGWTLREVEARSGVHNAHLSQIESGAIERPDTGLLWALAGLYELEFAELMRLAGRTEPAGQGGRGRRSLAGTALRALNDLTPEQQQQALQFMDELRRSGAAVGRSRRIGTTPDSGSPGS